LSAIDIPEGTKVNKVMNGGEDTLRIIMDLLGKKEFSGYVSIKLKSQNNDINSYLFVKDSKPTFGIREVISEKTDSDKKVRRVYAGESTIDDVKQDSFNEDAKIEIHSGIDVDSIINQYNQNKEESEKPEAEEEAADSRRVGLFWGGGGDNESLERQVLEEKMKNWENKGYIVSGLEEIFSDDFKDVKAAFDRYEEAINMLEELGAEIELLSMAGFENEVRNLREKLHDPSKILAIKAEIETLEQLAAEKDTDEAEDNGHKKVCIVCGFPLGDDAKCPRCGALASKKVEGEPKRDIELQSGRCYLVVEDKLDNTMNLFLNMLNKGYKGFGITRTNPRYLKEKGDLKDAKLIWLTDKESSSISTIPPILERIIYEFGDFVKRKEKTVVVLDGLEYLVSSNSFDPVVRFIRRIIDDVSESQSVFLVTIGPYTLKPQEMKILEREMEKISYIDKK
jgi:rubrerythrin